MKRLIFSLAALALMFGGVRQTKAGLVVNGDFETGNFSGWTVNALGTDVITGRFDDFLPNTGRFFAYLGNAHGLGTLSQTINDVPGQSYVLTMYLGSDGGTPNEFRVDWNGTQLYDQTNLPDTRSNASQYNLLSFKVVGTGSDTLTLSERNDPGFLALDDVSLTATPVPEPSTLVMCSILFGTFGVVWSYKRLKPTTAAA